MKIVPQPLRGAIVLGVLTALLSAQVRDQEQLARKYEQKLGARFLLKVDWVTDYDLARQKAKRPATSSSDLPRSRGCGLGVNRVSRRLG